MATRVGVGEFVYEVDERWGQLPASWSFVDVVGVVVDRDDRVFVFNRGVQPMIVFERDGRLARRPGNHVQLAFGVDKRDRATQSRQLGNLF